MFDIFIRDSISKTYVRFCDALTLSDWCVKKHTMNRTYKRNVEGNYHDNIFAYLEKRFTHLCSQSRHAPWHFCAIVWIKKMKKPCKLTIRWRRVLPVDFKGRNRSRFISLFEHVQNDILIYHNGRNQRSLIWRSYRLSFHLQCQGCKGSQIFYLKRHLLVILLSVLFGKYLKLIIL